MELSSSESATKVIAIDGPAGAGKSTIAKALARRMNFFYLDTGAMYRALTLKALRQNVNLEDESALVVLAKETAIDFEGNPQEGLIVLLDGEDVSEAVRTREVTNNTFYIARAAQVRAVMLEWQRAIGSKKNVVVEGRDIGTVVFPKATRKFYLDADFEERAKRRIEELEAKGNTIDADKLKEDLKSRDDKDFSRKVAPLKKADDAIVINSTDLSIEQVVERMAQKI